MHALEEIEHLLTTLTRAEKAQVLQWVVRDLGEAFPGIESTPGARTEIMPSAGTAAPPQAA